MSKPATHWRVLNALYDNRLRLSRRFLTRVLHDQNAGPDDLINLDMSDLIYASIDDKEIPVRKAVDLAPKRTLLHLSAKGRAEVTTDPGNQVRYTLGQHDKPIRLAKLFDGNTITSDDVSGQHRSGLISITVADVGEIDSPTSEELANRSIVNHLYVDYLFGDIVKVALTAKGRNYLPF